MHKIGPIEKLGTVWWFEIFDEVTRQQLARITQTLLETMAQYEQNYSRFEPDSLTSQLNTTGFLHNPSSELLDLLTIAQEAYDASNGVFNIAVGEYLEKSGYDSDYSFTPHPSLPDVPNLPTVLQVTPSKITLQPPAKIDLGGFGKGYLIDKLADILIHKLRIPFFLINGGGDMYGTSDHNKPIEIHLQDPHKPQQTLGTTSLHNQGFAASSPHLRQWQIADTTYTHLIGGIAPQAAYVTASTATQADIWATTCAIDGDAPSSSEVNILL